MAEAVKRRTYESPHRRRQAARTRAEILAAAGALFRESGYAVPMTTIATKAEVAVETIYRAFGTKAALFTAVVDAAVAGGVARADVPVQDRPAIRAIIEERDPRQQIALYVATQPGIHRRSGALLRALSAAAASDPELARLSSELEGARLAGQARFTGMLAERGSLRQGVDGVWARDVLWTLCSLAVYDALVGARGWGEERYRDWLTQALIHELLPSEAGPGSNR